MVGGAGYLGQSVVKMLLEAGANVLCIDLAEKAQDFVASLPGHTVQAATLDIRNGEEIKTFVQKNTAGAAPHGLVMLTFGSTAKNFSELTEKEWLCLRRGY